VDVRLTPARLATIALTLGALLLGAPSTATAEPPPSAAGSTSPAPARPDYLPPKPEGFTVPAREALAIAAADPKVAEATASHGRLKTAIQVKEGGGAWQVGFRADDQEVVQVIVDGYSGSITESWSGFQVAWPMARGNEGQFGHKLNAPWVWLPMAALFALGLFDFRRPLRIVHLDLLVLLDHFLIVVQHVGLITHHSRISRF